MDTWWYDLAVVDIVFMAVGVVVVGLVAICLSMENYMGVYDMERSGTVSYTDEKIVYVVGCGTPSSGISLDGPFDNYDDALAYRDKMTAIQGSRGTKGYGSYSVMGIYTPQDKGLPDVVVKAKDCGCCEHGK